MIDLVAGCVLAGAVGTGALAWTCVGRARAPRFERVERAGRSLLLGASPQRAAYWIAQFLGRALVGAGVSANAITLTSVPLAAVAAVAWGQMHYGLGALIAALSFACDALDGLVARATGTASKAGEVLDSVCDRICEALLVGGLAVAWRGSVPLLALVLCVGLAAQQVTLASAKAEVFASAGITVPRGLMRRAERAAYFVAGAAASGVLRDILPASRSGWALAPMVLAFALIAVVGNASALHRFVLLARALRSSPREVPRAAE
jgi:CDP-diacylglycerol--glycerol-3-phosphate 3-phosphatidyltransferase